MYRILGKRFNSLLNLETQHNSCFYLMPQDMLLDSEILSVSKKLSEDKQLDVTIQTGMKNFAQFRQYIHIKQDQHIMLVDNIGLDNSSELTDKLKLIIYDDNSTRTIIICKSDTSMKYFYNTIGQAAHFIKDYNSLNKFLKSISTAQEHINQYVSLDLHEDTIQVIKVKKRE